MGRVRSETGFDDEEYEDDTKQANTAELLERHRLLAQRLKELDALNTRTQPPRRGSSRRAPPTREQKVVRSMLQVLEDELYERGVTVPEYDG